MRFARSVTTKVIKPVKRVISYSLFWCGKDDHAKLYTNGIKAICRAHHTLFHDWTWRIHHDGSIDNDPNSKLLRKYAQAGLVELVDCGPEGRICRAMIWRMKPLWDAGVEYTLCRDMDSLPTPRELMAVRQFLDSKATMHCIADHPQHGAAIMGGLCGFRNSRFVSMTGIKSFESLVDGFDLNSHGRDQALLLERVWPALKSSLCEHKVGGHPRTPGSMRSFNKMGGVPLPDIPEAVVNGGGALIPFLGVPGFDFVAAENFYNQFGRPETLKRIHAAEQ